MIRRRHLLVTTAVGVVSIAGCSGGTADVEGTDGNGNGEATGDERDSTDATAERDDGSEDAGEAAFIVTTTQNATYLTNETVATTATVENTGNATGTRRIELIYNGTVLDGAEVELAPGDEHTINGEYDPETFELGDNELTVVTEGDRKPMRVTVERAGPGTDEIEIRQHELVVSEGYSTDVYVEGSVANDADQPARAVEVTVRVYDSDGDRTGSYTDEIPSVAASAEAEFFIDVFNDPDEFEEYDVRVTGAEY
jgi:hypothetical protein